METKAKENMGRPKGKRANILGPLPRQKNNINLLATDFFFKFSTPCI